MQVGFMVPNLRATDQVRHVVELADRLHRRGHDVRLYAPDHARRTMPWIDTDVPVRSTTADVLDRLDVLVFVHEPDWFLLELFENVRARVFYALDDGVHVGRPGSYDAERAPVDLQLACSSRVADGIERRTGHRPSILRGGIDLEWFPAVHRDAAGVLSHSTGVAEDDEMVRGAIAEAGLSIVQRVRLGRSGPGLAIDYSHVEAVVIGSAFDALERRGLEALASGVPLVTTAHGGSDDYAIDGRTALVVAPGDVTAMADALRRLGDDPELRRDLTSAGLDHVRSHHDWEQILDRAESLFGAVLSEDPPAPPPRRPTPPSDPTLSVVVLAWNNLPLTQAFVESVRANTDVPYELIVVDNGSDAPAPLFATAAADRSVLLPTNTGFAKGMNAGLQVARGAWIAFCNNDTELPAGWSSSMLDAASVSERPGVVVPAVTESLNPVTVRSAPGSDVRVLDRFDKVPSGVVYLTPARVIREIGGWCEDYHVASCEDDDLIFSMWVNGRDVIYDERILVAHVGKASANQLGNWQRRWEWNRRVFFERWQADVIDVRQLPDIDDDEFETLLAEARASAAWRERFHLRASQVVRKSLRRRVRDLLRPVWRSVRHLIPRRVRVKMRPDFDQRRAQRGPRGRVPSSADAPVLVRTSDGELLVLEDGHQRALDAATADAFRKVLGTPMLVAPAELSRYEKGAPVASIIDERGRWFVDIGGRPVEIDGLPAVRPMATEVLERLPRGPDIALGADDDM